MKTYRGFLIFIYFLVHIVQLSAQQCPLVAAVVTCQVGSPPVASTAIRLKWTASTFPGCTPSTIIPDSIVIKYTTQNAGGPIELHTDTIHKLSESCAEAPLYAVNYHAPQLNGCTCYLYYGQVVMNNNVCTYIDGFLPVELGAFKGNVVKNTAILDWTTITENKSAFFTIERSFDGVNYIAVGNVQATGTSTSPKNYSYVDNLEKDKVGTALSVYYRLLMLDVDGNFGYSPIVSLEIDRKGSGLAFINTPDFNNSNPTLYYFSDYEDITKCTISDMSGKTFFSQSVMTTFGNNEIHFEEEVQNLCSGIYILSLENKSGTISSKVLKIVE